MGNFKNLMKLPLFAISLSFAISSVSAQPLLSDDGRMQKWNFATDLWKRSKSNCDSAIYACRLMMRAARSMELDLVEDSIWQALETCPASVPLLYERGLYHFTFSDWESAQAFFEQGLEQVSDDRRGSFEIMLAICHRELGTPHRAVEHLNSFTSRLDLNNGIEDLANLSRLWIEFGRPDLSAEVVRSALDLKDPEDLTELHSLPDRSRDFFLLILFECAIELRDCASASLIAQEAAELPMSTQANWIGLELRRMELCGANDIDLSLLNELIKRNNLWLEVAEIGGRSLFQLPDVDRAIPDSLRRTVDTWLQNTPATSAALEGTSIWPEVESNPRAPIALGFIIGGLIIGVIWLVKRNHEQAQELPNARTAMHALMSWSQGQNQLTAAEKRRCHRALAEHANLVLHKPGRSQLQGREAQVQELLWNGLSHKEIAQQLDISVKYVYNISSTLRNKSKRDAGL